LGFYQFNNQLSVPTLSLWDIKGKIAGPPVYRLLGGSWESEPVYCSDGGWPALPFL